MGRTSTSIQQKMGETITLQRSRKASTHVLVSLSAERSTRSLRVRLLISIEGNSIKNKEIKTDSELFLHFSRSLSVKTWKVNEIYDTVNICFMLHMNTTVVAAAGWNESLNTQTKKKNSFLFSVQILENLVFFIFLVVFLLLKSYIHLN